MARTRPARAPDFALDLRGQIATHRPHTPTRGVWHSTESHDEQGLRDMQAIGDYWRRSQPSYSSRLGAHFLIDAEGQIAYGADPRLVTYAVAARNTGSVHVELIGFARFSTHAWFLRVRQLRALARLMAWLELEYAIPLRFHRDHGWSRHRDQPNQTHWDPGPGFPAGFVLRLARRYRKRGWS